ncbi:MAG: magnesium-translocating P-type ATPase [Actinobacteria bacterium]|nr:magnesium-translocating P-type ATPase [Actinomycetota bacterium]MDI6830572.1 magnesium-translocating P-type ATPase [Actinomycetota bacterium]
MQNADLDAFWNFPAQRLLEALRTSRDGLSPGEAEARIKTYGLNSLKPKKRATTLGLLLGQFKSPIIIILIFAAVLAAFTADLTDAIIILTIILFSAVLGFCQERGAVNAVEGLLGMIRTSVKVKRDGAVIEVELEDVVPGDIVVLNAGDIIPADGLVLSSDYLYVDESALTGESYPVEKKEGELPADTMLAARTNSLFMGTHVVSGEAEAVIVNTGRNTEFGEISKHLEMKPEETEFERGVRRFGYLLIEVTLSLVIAIFAINVALHRPVLDSFLFSLALAVGLTPQLLPAIISVNLSKGSRNMAARKVIVKKLSSIENFGSMNILCSDKTGTLTTGRVELHSATDIQGKDSEKVLRYAYLNAVFESGFTDPLDEVIRGRGSFDISGYAKLGEVPYDFIRKRLSVAVGSEGRKIMITKGAMENVLEICSQAEMSEGESVPIAEVRDRIKEDFLTLSNEGLRVLGVAYRNLQDTPAISKDDEREMTFLGFLSFSDPPKPDIAETIGSLERLGVSLKVITGDNAIVAASVSRKVGKDNPRIITGSDLRGMSDTALQARAPDTDVFAEVEPNQKERVILALRKSGNVVGYLGDGINDAPALHASDVGISVDSAVDVAKEAADIVLLEKDLGVLANGVREGRTTFANTLKYVFMATSANFGNMFSMAGASLFLSYLPLLPGQVLLTNLMTDFPEMNIATDRVDSELVERPRRWDIHFISRFMLVFGALSSVFDYVTFGVLLLILNASTNQFRTGWFVESVVSAAVIVLVIRTRRPFWRSMPGKALLVATILVVIATLALPYTPLAEMIGFEALPAYFYIYIVGIMVLYIASAEVAKKVFYAWIDRSG